MKINQILIGVIIVLIGMFGMMRSLVNFDFRSMTIMVIGLAFLLLYRQKKAVWPLFLGGYMTCSGLGGLLSWLGFGLSAGQMFAAMFFIVPGAIFMLLYFDKNKYGLLTPACILLWIGVGSVLTGALNIGAKPAMGIMGACFGLGFCTAYIIGRSYLSRGLLHIGLFLVAFSVLFSGGFISLAGGVPRIASYMLIAIGVLIILKSIIAKPR